jgi:endonuclease YncB( thermonuclease family)
LFATPALAQSSQTATVDRVIDGDTIDVNPSVSGTSDVRLIGVDTPETVDPSEPIEPFGPEASAFTKGQLEGKQVTLTFDEERTDQYGRALAYVQIAGQSETFNETLLKQGYAQLDIVPPNDRYEARFSHAQDVARQAHRGIWGLPKNEQCQLANLGNGIGEGSPGCAQQAPTPTPEPDPVDKNCDNYPSQAAAQAELRRNPDDPYGLDGPIGRSSTGIPGVACEDNPPPKDLRPAPGYDGGGGGGGNSGGGRGGTTPAHGQYITKHLPPGAVGNPNGVVPGTVVVKKVPNTGGPPYLAVGALTLLQRIAMTLSRMHATDTCLAVATP